MWDENQCIILYVNVCTCVATKTICSLCIAQFNEARPAGIGVIPKLYDRIWLRDYELRSHEQCWYASEGRIIRYPYYKNIIFNYS